MTSRVVLLLLLLAVISSCKSCGHVLWMSIEGKIPAKGSESQIPAKGSEGRTSATGSESQILGEEVISLGLTRMQNYQIRPLTRPKNSKGGTQITFCCRMQCIVTLGCMANGISP